MIGPVLGIPPWAAVALACGLTAVGVLVDLLRIGTVGTVFQIGYGAGCLLAVAWVRRRSIFLPAVQPPLLLAVVVPVLAMTVGAPSSTAGAAEHLLLAGAPLINAFPAMAVTTALVLVVAGVRLLRQRTGPDDAVGLLRARLPGGASEPADDRDHDPGDDGRAGRGTTAGRTTPRRSGRGPENARSGRADGRRGSRSGDDRTGGDRGAARTRRPVRPAGPDDDGRADSRTGARDAARTGRNRDGGRAGSADTGGRRSGRTSSETPTGRDRTGRRSTGTGQSGRQGGSTPSRRPRRSDTS